MSEKPFIVACISVFNKDRTITQVYNALIIVNTIIKAAAVLHTIEPDLLKIEITSEEKEKQKPNNNKQSSE